jgi:hypothetical protein
VGDIILALVAGFAGGFIGGLLGVGGGAIYIPVMVLIMDKEQHIAQGASLAAVVATGVTGAAAHLRQRHVDIPAVIWIAPVAVVTGFGAALLADQIDAESLRRIFAFVMVYFGLLTIVSALRGNMPQETEP